jgi:hypothetical protein
MGTARNIIGIGLLGALAYGVYKLFGMKQIADKVVTSLVKPRVHKVDLRGIVLRTEINIENPTRFRMNITKPVITLTSDGKYVTSTKPEQKNIEIQPMATSTIDTIEIVIPWTAIAGYATDIIAKIPELTDAWKSKNLKAFAKALAIPLEVKYSLYANGIYYQADPEKIL